MKKLRIQTIYAENFRPENQFKPERVTKDPNRILCKQGLKTNTLYVDEMNQFYQHQLAINTRGGPSTSSSVLRKHICSRVRLTM